MTGKAKDKKIFTPLKIYVIWQQEFENGKKYADELFHTFSRDESDFTGSNIGIPLYYLTTPNNDTKYFECLTANTEKTAFVFIINGSMGTSAEWKSFASSLVAFCKTNKNCIIYPVAIGSTKSAASVSSELAKINNIRLDEIAKLESDKEKQFVEKAKHLCFELTHELCRLLYDRERIAKGASEILSPSIKVFLSHARADGQTYARRINTYVSTETPLKTFIDVNDIQRGADFEDSIEDNIENAVLVAIYTDAYSSREWCQKEVLFAKQNDCPIIILDALSVGEVRRFPYGANTKTIHLGHDEVNDEKCKKIIYEILLETLKIKYSELFVRYSLNLYGIEEKHTKIFNYPPELYTLLMKLESNDKIVVYPEPPLNTNELSILSRYKPIHTFATPTLLPCIDCRKGKFLSGKNIGISISEIGTTGEIAQTDMHLTAFYTELCRYLLTAEADLQYAGNVNYKDGINFIEVLRELINNYCVEPEKTDRINIFHLPSLLISEEKKEELLPHFRFIQVNEAPGNSPPEEKLKANLTTLREQTIIKVFAQIVIGGKTHGYKGRYPGIIEEAYVAIKNAKPVFVLGAYGGAAEIVIRALNGEKLYDDEPNKMFNKIGFKGLNNGLSVNENIELARCNDIARAISLILKGLKNLIKAQEKECD